MHAERHVPHLSEPNSSAHLFITFSAARGASRCVAPRQPPVLGALLNLDETQGLLCFYLAARIVLKTQSGGLREENKHGIPAPLEFYRVYVVSLRLCWADGRPKIWNYKCLFFLELEKK